MTEITSPPTGYGTAPVPPPAGPAAPSNDWAAPAAGVSPDVRLASLKSDGAFRDALQNPFNTLHRHAQETWDEANRAVFSAKSGRTPGPLPANPDGSRSSPSTLTAILEQAREAPAAPSDYRFDAVTPGEVPLAREVATELGGLAHAVGLGQNDLDLLRQIEYGQTKHFDQTGTFQYDVETCWGALQQQHGADADRIVADAQSLLNSLPAAQKARALELLAMSGLANDPRAISHMAGIARRKAGKR